MANSNPITIDRVYPWGRSYAEYQRMFNLTREDQTGRIISCADGPASFNSEMNCQGYRLISCDPLYGFTTEEIRERISATHEVIVSKARENVDRFVWKEIDSPDELGRLRMRAMQAFIVDFDTGKAEGRYVNQSLPELSFADEHFDLALCSHFLFLYSDEFSLEFHIASVVEMCRVAREARIFPLLDMRGDVSSHLQPLLNHLKVAGLISEIETVAYEFQRGGNQMLRVRSVGMCG